MRKHIPSTQGLTGDRGRPVPRGDLCGGQWPVGGDLQEGSPIEPRVRGADGTGLETRAVVLVVGGSGGPC